MRGLTTPVTVILGVAVGIVLVMAAATAPAQATAYRYWTYWTGSGSSWTFSQVGPASTIPRDGAVEGWRFALSLGSRTAQKEPRISPSSAFQQFCGQVPAQAGKKRVAVVFDFGEVADAPSGQTPPQPKGACSVVPTDSTGASVLRRVSDLRVEGGLICAIGGYPRDECAPAVADPTAAPTRAPADEPDRSGNREGGVNKARQPENPTEGGSRQSTGVPTSSPPTQARENGESTPTSSDATPEANSATDETGSKATPTSRPTSTPTPVPTQTLPPPPTAGAAPAEVAFLAEEARSQPVQQQWLGWLAAGLAVAGVGALLWVRRRRNP